MIQFQVLSGGMAGAQWVARHFPVSVGRARSNNFRAEEPGVWDRHAVLECVPRKGFRLVACSGAIMLVNSEPVHDCMLKNGDVIEMGALKVRFWLSENRQSAMQAREWVTWIALGLITIGQIALIYWLLNE